MKLPISWLKEYVSFDITPEELADKITMTGLEVESVDSAVSFENVVIGEVLEREKHPNADKLNVAKVNVGDEVLQIVCGAPNLNVGQKVAVALVGAKLGDFSISKVELRGVESFGMICSEKELGIGDDHDGIMVLDKKAKVGTDFAEFIKAEKVLDIKIFANRPDMMGIEGLAREVSAVLNKKFVQHNPKFTENKQSINDILKIEVKDNSLCPRYVAKVVKNVKVDESPEWLKKRLASSGVRSINNIVDISNFVMLETGQPLHFFDLDKLGKSPKIVVRKAKKDEKIVTLDGVSRKLNDEMFVIADSTKPIAIAGVMGGENTEVDANTKNILIEAAVFEKSNIRKTSRLMGLRTEAVARFEKGLPFELPNQAIERAVELLNDIAEGEVLSGKIDVYKDKKPEKEIILSLDKIHSFLGVDIKEKDVLNTLDLLGFKVSKESDKYLVQSPWWRSDVESSTDLIEEIIRIWGYDKLPSTLPASGKVVPAKNESYVFSQKIRSLLSGIGLTEILTYSFISKRDLELVGEDVKNAPKLQNPLVSDQEFLRTSLVPHMLHAIRENQFNKESLKFYEIAKVFKNTTNVLPNENKQLIVGLTGGISWPINQVVGRNFYNLKGILERLFADLGIETFELQKSNFKELKDSSAANIIINGKKVGFIGEIKKNILDNFDLKKEVGVLVVDLDMLLIEKSDIVSFKEFSKYQKVERDLSVIMDEKKEVGEFVEALKKVDNLIKSVSVVDIYHGKPLEENQKSVTFKFEISSMEATLTDVEIDEVVNKCEDKIKKLEGDIRGAKKH